MKVWRCDGPAIENEGEEYGCVLCEVPSYVAYFFI